MKQSSRSCLLENERSRSAVVSGAASRRGFAKRIQFCSLRYSLSEEMSRFQCLPDFRSELCQLAWLFRPAQLAWIPQMHKYDTIELLSVVRKRRQCAYMAGSKKRSAAAAAAVAGGLQGHVKQLPLGSACGRRAGRRRAQRTLHVVSNVLSGL